MRRIFAYGLFGGLVLTALAFIIWQASPRVQAFYDIYYGSAAFKSLFYEGLGTSENLATVLSTILAFFYAASLIGVATWVGRLVTRYDYKEFIIGLIFFIIAYAAAPIAHVVNDRFGSLVCFNQTTGAPLKWYIIRSGKIIIYDSPGFDPAIGMKKEPITPEICRTFEQQKAGVAPRQISYQQAVEIGAKAWYFQRGDEILLFDLQDVVPGADELTKPITSQIIAELKLRIERQRRADALAEKRLQAEQLARQKAEKEQQEAEFKAQIAIALQQKRSALTILTSANRETATGHECRLREDGIIFSKSQNDELVRFSATQIFVERLQLNDGSLFARSKTVLAIQMLGPEQATDSEQQCLVYAISPAPDILSASQSARIEKLLSALGTLGARIVQRRPADPPADTDPATPPVSAQSFQGIMVPLPGGQLRIGIGSGEGDALTERHYTAPSGFSGSSNFSGASSFSGPSSYSGPGYMTNSGGKR